jgi:hypothetical protein
MKTQRILIAIAVLALFAASASHAQWFRISEGFSAIYELDQTGALAMKFPKNQSLTTWIAMHPTANAMVICHFLNVIAPAGQVAPNAKIKTAKHRVIGGQSGQQIAAATTKGTGRKSCKQVTFAAGETSVFVISTIKKVTKTFASGTTIVPSVNVFPGVLSSAAVSATLSDDEFQEFQKVVRRYAESIDPGR